MQDTLKPIASPDNLFHDGNPYSGELGTVVTSEWLNNAQSAIQSAQQEVLSVLKDSGQTPDPKRQDQLLQAVKKIAWGGNVKPGTLAGYGITDAQPLNNNLTALANLNTTGLVVDTGPGTAATRAIVAGQGVTVSNGDGKAGNPAIALANSGAAAGTYGMVTVDAMGRVTAGRQMQPADVPGLDWSKITSGMPTTLAGYGIADAAPLDAAGRSSAQSFRAAKGLPTSDNSVVGYAFGSDGDTGMFTDYSGSNANTGSKTINLRIDSKDVLIADITGRAWIAGYGWLHEKFAGIEAAPPGKVSHFAMTAPPAGWVKCDGALLSRAAYPALFAAIGTTFGAGDGKTTFGVPDLRGEFLRGWDDGRGADSGRAFGTWQADDFKSHTHGITNGMAPISVATSAGSTNNGKAFQYNDTGTTPITNTGGTETRPRNVALLACIKI